jgi:hypothetical protein
MRMRVDSDMPDWVQSLFETLAATIELEGMTYVEGRYSSPEETDWGIDLLEIAPALMEIAAVSSHATERVFGSIRDFDLLAAQDVFNEVTAMSLGIDDNETPCLTIEGMVSKREIVVLVRMSPFGEA